MDWTVEAAGQRRGAIVVFPPDWPKHYADLHLLVFLHGGGQSAEEFLSACRVRELMAGDLHLENGVPQPKKFVAIFVRGLQTQQDPLTGQWNAYPMGEALQWTDLDDVTGIATVIIEVTERFRAEFARLRNAPLGSVGVFWRNAKKVFIGFSQGGQMVYRLAAEIGLVPLPGAWNVDLAPHTIVVCAASQGGLAYAGFDPVFGNIEPNPNLPGAAVVTQWIPATAMNVLHLHGYYDQKVRREGGVSEDHKRNVDTACGGTDEGNYYYRADVAPGPDDPSVASPDLAATGLLPFVNAIGATGPTYIPGAPLRPPWAGGGLPPVVAPLPAPAGPLPPVVWPPYTSWTWADAVIGHEVMYVLWPSDPSFNGGHHWPNQGRDRFEGMRLAWDFMESHP